MYVISIRLGKSISMFLFNFQYRIVIEINNEGLYTNIQQYYFDSVFGMQELY